MLTTTIRLVIMPVPFSAHLVDFSGDNLIDNRVDYVPKARIAF